MANPALRKAFEAKKFIVAPGIFDMISAKVADGMGFDCLYGTGFGTVASHLGVPDAGIATYADMVSRMGGEEFLVICGRSDLAETRQLAERLRLAVEKHETRLTNGHIIKVTISCGVAGWKSSYSNDNDLLKDTDRALYQAKQNGRNRVEVVQ